MSTALSAQVCTFFLNNRRIEAQVRPDETALELLRQQYHLTGTRESCSEGDCGACTIAVGQWFDSEFRYTAVNSCLYPAVRLHGKHVITVEGIASGDQLHPIQTALLQHHAVQCGFCTPGIVMSLFCWLVDHLNHHTASLEDVLEGNLCRCTGYVTISNAGRDLLEQLVSNALDPTKLLPHYCNEIQNQLRDFHLHSMLLTISNHEQRTTQTCLRPETLDKVVEALQANQRNDFQIVNGATDIGVLQNVKQLYRSMKIDLSNVHELNFITTDHEVLRIGGTTTFQQIIEHDVIAMKFPALHTAAKVIGSRQIRNVATLAGNIANASPIADGTIAALALDGSVELLSAQGIRNVLLSEFFLDYKVTALQKNEVITAIHFPIRNQQSRFYKSSKRVAVDIASVNSCCVIEQSEDVVVRCKIAVGGVDKIPRLAVQAAQSLIGRSLTSEVIRECSLIAATEFTPISDVRGSSWFRTELVKNQISSMLESFANLELATGQSDEN